MSSAAPRPISAVLKRPRPIAWAAGARSDAVPRRRRRALAGSAVAIVEDADRLLGPTWKKSQECR